MPSAVYRNAVPILKRFLLFIFLFFFHQAYAQVITTIAGNGFNGYSGDGGTATSAGVIYPSAVCLDPSGNLYITCSNSVRKIAAGTGIITRFAGNGTYSTTGDGGQAVNASMRSPISVCSDATGNIYIAEYGGNCVRKVSTSGIITTVAGTGTAGFSGDGGPAVNATLDQPWGVTVDNSGNIYIADFRNHRIRKVTAATGIISTFAGTGTASFSGDGGPASSASVAAPNNVFADNNGNVFISEASSGITCRIRKVAAGSGIITTVAGNGAYAYSGDGGPAVNASLFSPTSVVTDASGNLYISEYDDSRIRKVDAATGIITTIAGTGTNGFSGDGGPATSAMLHYPRGLALDAAGNLYVADNSNHRIRKIGNTPLCATPTISISAPFTLYCYNQQPIISSSVTNAGTNPVYQWKKNGVNDGTNSPTFTGTIAPNDVITCHLTTTDGCGNTVTVVSNSITIQSNPGYNSGPEVTISSSQQSICSGTTISFTATNVSGSANPVYQWLVNGNAVGTNSPNFSTNTLTNGAVVECVMTVPHCGSNGGSNGGSTKDVSNPINITVSPRLNPSISIAASANNICKGTPVTFTATAAQGGTNPSFEWRLNGVPAGSNTASFTSSALNNGDVISCEYRADPAATCVSNASVVSNNVVMNVKDIPAPSIQITATQSELCAGTPVAFAARASDAGSAPSYQWQINGVAAGSNGPSFTTSSLANGDRVSCTLTASNSTCVSQAASNTISMVVHPQPTIQFNPSRIVINPGQQATINANVQGNVSWFQWTPAGVLTNPSSLTVLTRPLNATTTFQLSVSTPAGCSDSKSVVVAVYSKLYMPSAFTPNHDGKNDVFRIPPNTPLTLKEFAVYDRWGNKVFSTSDINRGWDGTIKGVTADSNSFVYVVSGTDDHGEVFLKGTVVLIR